MFSFLLNNLKRLKKQFLIRMKCDFHVKQKASRVITIWRNFIIIIIIG